MPTESELRLHRCCFTGHRPEKLLRSTKVIRTDLEREIHKAISDGFTVFITGMARGVDLEAGEIVLRLRSEGFPIRLICACPYQGFERSWSVELAIFAIALESTIAALDGAAAISNSL